MTQETIMWCLGVLNASCPFDEHIDYDDDTKEFVFMYFIDIADPEGMGGISTRVHEYNRCSEDSVMQLVKQICSSIDSEDAVIASCVAQSEIPQEAWDICGIEELDYPIEVEWELSNEEVDWSALKG